jgi:hypothetical protein
MLTVQDPKPYPVVETKKMQETAPKKCPKTFLQKIAGRILSCEKIARNCPKTLPAGFLKHRDKVKNWPKSRTLNLKR